MKYEQYQTETPSKWREEAEFRKANREWIRESQRIESTLKTAIQEGMGSGIAIDFNPKEHLQSLKAKKRNGQIDLLYV